MGFLERFLYWRLSLHLLTVGPTFMYMTVEEEGPSQDSQLSFSTNKANFQCYLIFGASAIITLLQQCITLDATCLYQLQDISAARFRTGPDTGIIWHVTVFPVYK